MFFINIMKNNSYKIKKCKKCKNDFKIIIIINKANQNVSPIILT